MQSMVEIAKSIQNAVQEGGVDLKTENSNEDVCNENTGDFGEADDDSGEHRCEKCPLIFTHRVYLEMHMKHGHIEIETHKRHLSCDLCGKLFNSTRSLQAHISVHKQQGEDRGTFWCDQCSMAFENANLLIRHFKDYHDRDTLMSELRFSCEVCSKPFPDLLSLRIHKVQLHDKRCLDFKDIKEGAMEETIANRRKEASDNYLCSFCLLSLDSESILHSHVQRYHSKAPQSVCPLCGKTIAGAFLLAKHLLDHALASKNGTEWDDAKEERTCQTCRTVFETTDELLKHSCKIDANQCHLCRKKVQRAYRLKTHLYKHLETDDAHECQICGIHLRSKRQMTKHMACHSSHPKPFKCEVCESRFSDFTYLHKHKMRHDDKYVFVCYICGLEIRKPSRISRHMLERHGIEKVEMPFSCDKCSRKCYTKGALEAHYRIHPNKVDVPCDRCDMKFPNNRLQKLHIMEVHQGKVHQCQVCQLKFDSDSKLRSHEDSHRTNPVPCPCLICFVTLPDKAELQKHMSEHKKDLRRCSRCFLDVPLKRFDFHKLTHLNFDSLVKKHCILCGEVLSTVYDVFKHCLTHIGIDFHGKLRTGDFMKEDLPIFDLPVVWYCTICSKPFQTEEQWMGHMEGHDFDEEDPVKCCTCDGYFFQKGDFIKHITNCVKAKKLRETEIGSENYEYVTRIIGITRRSFFSVGKVSPTKLPIVDIRTGKSNISLADAPGSSTANVEIVQMEECLETDDTSSVSKEIDSSKTACLKSHPNNRHLTCILCFRFFSSADGLAYHLLTTCEEIEDDKCWRCHETFGLVDMLQRHIKNMKDPCKVETHRNLRVIHDFFPCSACERKFKGEIFLALHATLCHEPGTYNCTKCSAQFEYRLQLERHIFQHADSDASFVTCVACGGIFNKLSDLNVHMKTHKELEGKI